MISKSHYPSSQNYTFSSNKSHFDTKFSQVNDTVFDTKFSKVNDVVFDAKFSKVSDVVFDTKFSKVNDTVFDTKFSQVGAIAEIYEQDLIIYDGGSVEGWEDELPNEKI